jgi:hypothetical protein
VREQACSYPGEMFLAEGTMDTCLEVRGSNEPMRPEMKDPPFADFDSFQSKMGDCMVCGSRVT